MRLLAALAALLLAAPAAAQDKPAWVGVWEGKVGTYPVRACFDTWGEDGPGRGSYYYKSRLEPISLSDYDSEGGWTEQTAGSDRTARWEFAERGGTRLRGTWRQDQRSLPFNLVPVSWTDGEWGGPCSSDAFLAPLAGGGAVDSEGADLDGWRYTKQVYRAPARLADEVSVATFAYPPRQPGDAAINNALATALPRGTVRDDYIQCFAGAIASLGLTGDFHDHFEPTFASDAFLVVLESYGGFCGGAHPNYYFRHLTYDRASGREVDLFDWLGEVGVEHFPAEQGAPAYATVRPTLRGLIASRDPTDDPFASDDVAADAYAGECVELAREQEFRIGYSIFHVNARSARFPTFAGMTRVGAPSVRAFTAFRHNALME